MAFYSALEVNEILKKLSQEPASEVKFLKFERLGILVDPEDESSLTKKEQDDENATQLYACSVCSKKLISAHLLDLHVTENHDSYFELQKDKKPMVSKTNVGIMLSFTQFCLLTVRLLSRRVQAHVSIATRSQRSLH